jgi:opacity protein-like surface antigen
MTKTKYFIIVFTAGACGLIAPAAFAQETSHFAYEIGTGFTTNAGSTGRNIDLGWNAGFGVGYNFNTHLGALVDFDFNDNGINSTTLANLGYPGGSVHVWDVSLDPIVHLTPAGPIDFYITGGGGLYHYYQQFTAPTVATFTEYNPFFGFYQAGIPTNEILDSYSVNRPGFDIGAGIAFGGKWHSKFFAQAKWQRVLFENGHYDMIPVTFGLRF